uniref:Uncharacterized protein n=1 Tax=Timema cristinae TaxID=61476 RepID=A0A7R9H5G4_TIMCR|nr:unnamed protein product [Timema cristinae]
MHQYLHRDPTWSIFMPIFSSVPNPAHYERNFLHAEITHRGDAGGEAVEGGRYSLLGGGETFLRPMTGDLEGDLQRPTLSCSGETDGEVPPLSR